VQLGIIYICLRRRDVMARDEETFVLRDFGEILENFSEFFGNAKHALYDQRDHFMPVVRSFYDINGCTGFSELCSKYGIADVHRSIFCKHVWNVFISSISV